MAIKTILLDQIFGFDPAGCGFDVTKPTPFNGEQNAGPNAMISLPNPRTNLGPLCTGARKQGSSFVCTQ